MTLLRVLLILCDISHVLILQLQRAFDGPSPHLRRHAGHSTSPAGEARRDEQEQVDLRRRFSPRIEATKTQVRKDTPNLFEVGVQPTQTRQSHGEAGTWPCLCAATAGVR